MYNITLKNAINEKLSVIETKAFDTNIVYLCIPKWVQQHLELKQFDSRVITQDGLRIAVPYVGPIFIQIDNKYGYVGAIVTGDDIVVGSIPIDDLDLAVAEEVFINERLDQQIRT